MNKQINLQQVKEDLERGVMISRTTWAEVLGRAIELEAKLLAIQTRNLNVEEQ
jgi:hypothetical protein